MSRVVLVGFGLVVVAAAWAAREHAIIRSSVITVGKVTDFRTYVDSGRWRTTNTAAPLVVFTTRAGREVILEGVASGAPGVELDDEVPVAYSEESPENGRILRFSYRFGFSFIVGSFGLLLIALRLFFSACRPLMAMIYKAPAVAGR
jgi:hypothetical protein